MERDEGKGREEGGKFSSGKETGIARWRQWTAEAVRKDGEKTQAQKEGIKERGHLEQNRARTGWGGGGGQDRSLTESG